MNLMGNTGSSNLSPDSPKLDLYLSNDTMIFEKVDFEEVTSYLEFYPNKYTMEVKISKTNDTILFVPNIVLKPNRFYSIYTIGLLGAQPYLQVVIPLDGSSYLTIPK